MTQCLDRPADPLSLRAWTLQEEYLSTRKVKFTSQQMLWHCQSVAFEEQGWLFGMLRPASLPTHFTFQSFKENNLQLWKSIVINYSARRLTFHNDRLPALAGLASEYRAQTGLDYLAGLWSGRHLFELLLWFRIPETTNERYPSEYLAPSWSWIAANNPVDFKQCVGPESNHNYNHIARLLTFSTKLKGLNPFSEITDGYLDLSAPAITTTIATNHAVNEHDSDSVPWRDNSIYLKQLLPEHVMESISPTWTWPVFHLDQNDYGEDLIVHCLVLGCEWWGDEDHGVSGILLTPISTTERTFRRIGMFDRMPKFQNSDQELDMLELIAKRMAATARYTESYVQAQGGTRSALISRQGLWRRNNSNVSPELEEEFRKVAEFEEEGERGVKR